MKTKLYQKLLIWGVYFNGCYEGLDCPCCGDRWHEPDVVEIEKLQKEGYLCYTHSSYPESKWFERYDKYDRKEEPQWATKYSFKTFGTKIYFKDIEEYFQYRADEWGWTDPDVRIFYADGSIKEITGKVLQKK